MPKQRLLGWTAAALAGPTLSACGPNYTVFHPVGPVGRVELRLIVLSTIVVAVIIFLIWALWLTVLIRFRDKPHNTAPYRPEWRHHRVLEVAVFVLPVVALLILAIPTVRQTYALARVPSRHPLVVDVTSLDYKWVFQYPTQRIATVNYLDIPVGRPVLFQLTSHSPMAAFWVPNLGGMEYAMPNRVLPLWLEADRAGTYLGRNSNFDGMGYWRMTFQVHAVPSGRFNSWVQHIKRTQPQMTEADWHRLLLAGVSNQKSYSAYPADTFPERVTEFTIKGLHYVPTHKP